MKFISLSARVQRSINLNSPKLIQSMSELTNDIILSKHDKATKIARQQQRSSLNFIFSFPARDLHRIRLKCVPGDVKCKKKKRRSVEQWWSTALWDNQTATIHSPENQNIAQKKICNQTKERSTWINFETGQMTLTITQQILNTSSQTQTQLKSSSIGPKAIRNQYICLWNQNLGKTGN